MALATSHINFNRTEASTISFGEIQDFVRHIKWQSYEVPTSITFPKPHF